MLRSWHKFHEKLAAEAAAWRSLTDQASLVMIGDSITESYRGTAVGLPTDRSRGLEASLGPTLLQDFSAPLILAISGDETQHLLWRLENGELSPALCADARLWITLMIGTNNLGNAKHSKQDTAAGVEAVVRYLLTRTKARVLVHAMLPRGESPKSRAARLNRSSSSTPPPSMIPAIDYVNARVARFVYKLGHVFPGRARSIDCGHIFGLAVASSGAPEVNMDLMPDALHPNLEGSRRLADCVRQALATWRREARTATASEL